MRTEREEIVKRMISTLSGGDTQAKLFQIYKGEASKEDVFTTLLGNVSAFDQEVENQTNNSKSATESINTSMAEFNSIKVSASQDDSALNFFREIDEGLKSFNENVTMLSNGANFYK